MGSINRQTGSHAVAGRLDGRQEKPARAALFTAVQRMINKDTILIVDGMNYIKGYRYQLYCAAREQQVRVCTVGLCRRVLIFLWNPLIALQHVPSKIFVVAKPEHCREWNHLNRSKDGETDIYSASTYEHHNLHSSSVHHSESSNRLDNLIARYEEPNSMVRWDSPLFTVPWSESDIPGPEVFDAITSGIVKPPNVGTSTVRTKTMVLQRDDEFHFATGYAHSNKRSTQSRTNKHTSRICYHVCAIFFPFRRTWRTNADIDRPSDVCHYQQNDYTPFSYNNDISITTSQTAVCNDA